MSQPYMDSFDPPQTPPERQGGRRWLMGLGIGCGLLLLICCGVGGYFMYAGQRYMKNAVSQNPAEVQAATREIAPMRIPPELKPQMVFNMRIPFTDQVAMRWVAYADQANQSMLVLAEMGEMFSGQDKEQMRVQLSQSLDQQGARQQNKERFIADESHARRFVIGGQPASFTFAKGKLAQSKKPWMQVNGVFENNGRMVMLMLSIDPEQMSEEEVVAMLLTLPDAREEQEADAPAAEVEVESLEAPVQAEAEEVPQP